jgi:PAS domain S-box-containing protein
MQGVGRDISARKLLEQQLKQSEREFSTLVENSPDVICRLNRDGRYIYASPNVTAVLGIGPEAFIGKTPSELGIPDFDATEYESKCREAIDNKAGTVMETQYHGRHYRTRIIPEYSADGVAESVLTNHR